MFRKLTIGLAFGVGLFVTCLSARAANFFSPTQAQLNTAAFTDFWAGNGASLNSTTLVGTDGVKYDFNTGYASPTPDAFSRSQFQIPFTQDLTGDSNLGIAFLQNTSANGHQLQA